MTMKIDSLITEIIDGDIKSGSIHVNPIRQEKNKRYK